LKKKGLLDSQREGQERSVGHHWARDLISLLEAHWGGIKGISSRTLFSRNAWEEEEKKPKIIKRPQTLPYTRACPSSKLKPKTREKADLPSLLWRWRGEGGVRKGIEKKKKFLL